MSRRRILVVVAVAVAAIFAWLFVSSGDPDDAPRLDRVKSLPYLGWSG